MRGKALLWHGDGALGHLAASYERDVLLLRRYCTPFELTNPSVTLNVCYHACVCAELVAAVLKEGGLLDPISNPGAATPQGLHELYRGRATTTANPYLLRQANCQRTLTTNSVVQERHYTPPALQHQQQAPARAGGCHSAHAAHAVPATATFQPARSDIAQYAVGVWSASASSRNTALRVLNEGTMRSSAPAPQQLGITLNSLNFRSSR